MYPLPSFPVDNISWDPAHLIARKPANPEHCSTKEVPLVLRGLTGMVRKAGWGESRGREGSKKLVLGLPQTLGIQ